MTDDQRWAAPRAVAKNLGDGWYVATGYSHGGSDAYLRGPREQQLHVTYGGASHRRTDWGRVFFASSLPDHLRSHQSYGDPGPAVSVSESRPPAAIAADLRRRLLPRHRAYLRRITAQTAADTAEQARAAQLRILLLEILTGANARWLEHSQHVIFGQVGDLIEGNARVQPYTSTVTFVIDVQRKHAPDLARALAALRATLDPAASTSVAGSALAANKPNPDI